jgi:hypothetical protein
MGAGFKPAHRVFPPFSFLRRMRRYEWRRSSPEQYRGKGMRGFSIRKGCLHVAAVLVISTLMAHSQQSGGGIFSLGISDDANVQFVWRANPEPDLGGYRLYVGTTPGVYAGFIDVGNVTTFKANDLIRGMIYYFALTAYNTSGLESDPTPELSAQLPMLDAAPSPQIAEPGYTNRPPYFEPLPDLAVAAGTINHHVLLLDVRAGPDQESNVVTFAAISSSPELIPNPEVTYTNPDTSALVALRPVLGATGIVTITITANDGQAENNTFSRSFSVTVESLNTPPVIGRIPNLWLFADRPTPIPLTIIDAETSSEDIEVIVSSSNREVVPPSGLTIIGSGTNRSLVVDPSSGRVGVSTVTVTASDGSSSASMSFDVTVLNVPKL